MYSELNESQDNISSKYWLNTFENNVDKSYFPYDRNFNKNTLLELEKIEFSLDSNLSKKIIQLSNKSDHRLYMILFSGLVTTIYKYTRNKNITLGTTIFEKDIADKIYSNTILAINTNLNDNDSYKQLLISTMENMKKVLKHQNYPIEKLLYNLNLSNFGKCFPLTDIFMQLNNIQDKQLTKCINSNFIILFEKVENKINAEIRYNKNLYEDVSIKRLFNNYANILNQCTNDVDIKLNQIDGICDLEKSDILCNFNNTLKDFKNTKPIHNLFEEQVIKSKNKIAVVYNDYKLSYDELNLKSNALANLLISRGVKKKDYVPVLLNRGPELVISLLGILKAGAVYVPLDINWPQERVENIIKDVNASVIIKNEDSINYTFENLEIININSKSLNTNTKNLDIKLELDDPMYVIYTSGSSGTPKGTINKYEGIINRFLYMNDRYGVKDNDVVLLTSNHVFDASIWQLLWPLINGLKVIIPNNSKGFDIDTVIDLIDSEKVTITDFVPSVFNILTSMLYKNKNLVYKISSIRQLLIGGESMNSEVIYKFKQLLPNVSITNTYGPSEASIGTIFYEVKENYESKIPIGKPISNVHALILDENKQIVPIGSTGEIYLGGKCVGLGYINDISKTNSSFIKLNHIDKYNNELFYKTGDLAKWRYDGNIEYIGRIDNQIKIRGQRIELGEIESQMLKIKGIDQVKVIHKKDINYNDQSEIYAYYVSKVTYSANELKSIMLKYLPSYMIPKYLIQLDQMPLTYTGKLDEKSLPDPEYINKNSFISPRNDFEKNLAKLWADILGIDIEEISIESDFFELGGHSLFITLLASELRDLFNVNISLDILFEKTKLRELALEIENLNICVFN